MNPDRIVYFIFAGIIPIGVVSPKALVIMLVLATFSLLLLNREKLDKTFKRGIGYFCFFLPLLVVGILSSFWSLESGLSFVLGIKLFILAFTGCIAISGVIQLSAARCISLSHAINLGLILGGALLLFEVATGSWLYRISRGYTWDQVIFEATGGINLDSPIKSGVTVFSIFVWILFVNKRGRIAFSSAVILVILYIAWEFGSRATLVALPLGLGLALAARFSIRPVLIFLAGCFFLTAITSPFVAKVALKGTTPLNIYSNVGDTPMPISAMNRLITWKFVSQKIMAKPLTGWGLKTSRIIPGGEEKYNIVKFGADGSSHIVSREFFIPLHPHNQFLQVWMELGLLGAICLALGGGLLILRVSRLRTEDNHSAWLIGAIIALISYSQISFGAWQNWWIAGQFLSLVTLLLAITASNKTKLDEEIS